MSSISSTFIEKCKSLIFPIANKFEMISAIENHVIQSCGHRPPSHNHLHMMTVRDNAIWIFNCHVLLITTITLLIVKCLPLIIPGFWSDISISLILFAITYVYTPINIMIQTVALLHDVADHKYVDENPEILANLEKFLNEFTVHYSHVLEFTPVKHLFNMRKILDMTERISFSRQKKLGTVDWYPTLGFIGTFVRNVVSDADKFEAIGKYGIERCYQYTLEKFDDDNLDENTKKTKIAKLVIEHYHDKLKHISSSTYMKTVVGLIYSWKLHHEMNSFLKSIDK